MLDQCPILVQLVEDEVSVGLVSGCEDHNLVQLRHVCQESNAEGPNLVDHTPVLEVHESLIEVQHERVLAVLGVGLVAARREQRFPIHDIVRGILLGITI